MPLMNIDDVNRLDRGGCVAALGWVFEGSPWVAERAWAMRPFASLDSLHRAMVTQVENAGADDQLALLRAHPDLGARYGSAPSQQSLSDASSREQAGAGLDSLTATELERLRALNAGYSDKFGFPFVVAVKGRTKHDILDALERRLTSPRDEEQREALKQVFQIARFRLEDAIS